MDGISHDWKLLLSLRQRRKHLNDCRSSLNTKKSLVDRLWFVVRWNNSTWGRSFYLGRQYPHSWECERQNQSDKSIYVFNFEKGKFDRGKFWKLKAKKTTTIDLEAKQKRHQIFITSVLIKTIIMCELGDNTKGKKGLKCSDCGA